MNLMMLLIGGNPIANYALIEYFNKNGNEKIPQYDSVMLVFTKQTQKVASNIKKLETSINYINVSLEDKESNLSYIQKKITDALNKITDIHSIHLNYTGGRKPMSIGAYLAVKEYDATCQKIYSDIDPSTYKLTLEDGTTYLEGGKTISTQLAIPIEDFYILHNWNKPTYKTEHSEFYSGAFCRFLLEQSRDHEKEFYEELWDKKDDIHELNWQASLPHHILNIPKKLSLSKLKALQKFIRGIWLEEYLFDILLELKKEEVVTDIAWNVESRNEKKEFEVDVIAIVGYKSFVFSCTTDKKAYIKQKGFEVALKAEQIGGRGSNPILVSLADNKNKEDVKADTNRIEKNLQSFGIDDISNKDRFKRKLREILTK